MNFANVSNSHLISLNMEKGLISCDQWHLSLNSNPWSAMPIFWDFFSMFLNF
jgi:hypothetical protein